MAFEHIDTDDCGSNIIIKNKRSKYGRKVYIELRSHFHNDYYKKLLATTANKSIGYAMYHG